jgi:hypothetical protein
MLAYEIMSVRTGFATKLRGMLKNLLSIPALTGANKGERRTLKIAPRSMGYKKAFNHDSVESLLELGENPFRR